VTISIKIITDMSEFQKIENEFDCFVSNWSENPFFSSIFVKLGAQLSSFRGWDPLLLIIYDSNKIVGIAPLARRKKFGVCFVQFLYGPNFLMDFVVDEKFREVCVSKILHTLTTFLKCKFVDLTFSEESATLAQLEKACKASHIDFYTEKSWFGGHRIIPVTSKWDEFVKTKGKKFRANIRNVERKIEGLGNWRVTCVERFEDDPEVCEKIIRIYTFSWKRNWMTCRGIAYDPELAIALNALRKTQKNKSNFAWKVYFLELNGVAIAYVLIFRDKGTAFLKRGSYDDTYKQFSPGFFLYNYAIRDLFNEAKVHTIDWCADHHYQKFWAHTCLSRTDIKIRPGLLLATLERLLTFPIVKSAAYPLYLLRDLLIKHRANPSIKDFHNDQNQLKLTACGKYLT
jgi:hypothetical protein